MDLLLLSFALCGVLAVALLIEATWQLWSSTREVRRMRKRLRDVTQPRRGAAAPRRAAAMPAEGGYVAAALRRALPLLERLELVYRQADLGVSLGRFAATSAAAGAAGLAVLAVLDAPARLVPMYLAAALAVPALIVLRWRRRRVAAMERQLPEVMELIARALRAGHSFSSALQTVAEEGPRPLAEEFQVAAEEVTYGASMADALDRLARRVPSGDLRFFVIAVSIQRDTGGNLAELLDTLTKLIRARFQFAGKLRVLSSEGRASAYILSALPFALVAIIHLLNPEFIAVLWKDPAGIRVVVAGLAMMAIGIFWMWRTVQIRV